MVYVICMDMYGDCREWAVFSVYGGEVIEVLKILFAKSWKILYTDSIEGF